MNTTRLLTTTKRFLGPIICVAFCWLFIRWIGVIIVAVRLWPWCEFSPPPQQTYVLAIIGAISFGIAPLWLLGCFIHMGCQWFRMPEGSR